VKGVIKVEKITIEDDPYRLKACEELFDDLFAIKDQTMFRMDSNLGEDWKGFLRSNFRTLMAKYQDCFDPEFLTKKFSGFARTHFNLEI